MQIYFITLKKLPHIGRFQARAILGNKKDLFIGEILISKITREIEHMNYFTTENIDYYYEYYYEIYKERRGRDTYFGMPCFHFVSVDDVIESNQEIQKFLSEVIQKRVKPTIIKTDNKLETVLKELNFSNFRYNWEILYGDGFDMWEDESAGIENLCYILPFTWQMIEACVGNGYKNFPEQKINYQNFDSQREPYELFFKIEITFTEDNSQEYLYFTVGSTSCYEKYLRSYFSENPGKKIMQPCAWGFYEFYNYEMLYNELDTIATMVTGSSKLEILTKFSTFLDCPNLLNYQPDYPPDTPDLYYFDGNVEIIDVSE